MIVKYNKTQSLEFELDYELDFEEGLILYAAECPDASKENTYVFLIKRDDFIIVERLTHATWDGVLVDKDIETYSICDFIKKFESISLGYNYRNNAQHLAKNRFYVGPRRKKGKFKKILLTISAALASFCGKPAI